MIAIARQLLAVLLLLMSLGSFADAGTHCAPPRYCTGAGILCDCGGKPSPARIASCLQDCQLQVLAAPPLPAIAVKVAVLDLSPGTGRFSGFATAPPVPPPRFG